MKGSFKGCREQWVDGFDEPHTQPPAEQYPGGSGEWANRWWLPLEKAVTEGNLADQVFLPWIVIEEAL